MALFSSKSAPVAPIGIQNQMYGQPSRVPGYSQGLNQAPGHMAPALPPEPYPIGRPTAVVGGPAYYTPPGFQAPPQPTEAFVPTDVMPDPIGQQFSRQIQSPMGQQFVDQYIAGQAPIREAEAAKRAEEMAAQDARFQEMMARIAELEGQLATPMPDAPPGVLQPVPYIPGQDTFPGLPDYLQNLDFSGLPDMSFDYDNIMRNYQMPPPPQSVTPDFESFDEDIPIPDDLKSIQNIPEPFDLDRPYPGSVEDTSIPGLIPPSIVKPTIPNIPNPFVPNVPTIPKIPRHIIDKFRRKRRLGPTP